MFKRKSASTQNSDTFCSKCGAKLGGGEFCPQCGAPSESKKPLSAKKSWIKFGALSVLLSLVTGSIAGANAETGKDTAAFFSIAALSFAALMAYKGFRVLIEKLKQRSIWLGRAVHAGLIALLLSPFFILYSSSQTDQIVRDLNLLQESAAEVAAVKLTGDDIVKAGNADQDLVETSKRALAVYTRLSKYEVSGDLEDYKNSIKDWAAQVGAFAPSDANVRIEPKNKSYLIEKALAADGERKLALSKPFVDRWSTVPSAPRKFELSVSSGQAVKVLDASAAQVASTKEFGEEALKKNNRETMRYITGRLQIQGHFLDGVSTNVKGSTCSRKSGCLKDVQNLVFQVHRTAYNYVIGNGASPVQEWQVAWAAAPEEIKALAAQPIGGIGVTQGASADPTLPPQVNSFFAFCSAPPYNGAAGGMGGVMSGLPTTQGGYDCWYDSKRCWMRLTYGGTFHAGGNPGAGCLSANVFPVSPPTSVVTPPPPPPPPPPLPPPAKKRGGSPSLDPGQTFDPSANDPGPAGFDDIDIPPDEPVSGCTPQKSWDELLAESIPDAEQQGWSWMWFGNGCGGIHYYRKEGDSWVEKASEEEAKQPYGSSSQPPPPPPPPPPSSHVSVTGQWQGSFDVGSGGVCSGYGGNWSMILNDQNGSVSGSFDAVAQGYVVARGSVGGSTRGDDLSFDVGGGGSGVDFTGGITGDTIRGTYTAYCPVDGARASGDFWGTRTTRELPPPPLACSPQHQIVSGIGINVTFSASGGKGTYNWTTSGASPNTGSGSSFTTSYFGTRDYSVKVSSGSQEATCTVFVCPAPPPPPTGDGPTPYVSPGCPRE